MITAATAMSVKNASEAKTRCFILAGPTGKERPRRQITVDGVSFHPQMTRSSLKNAREEAGGRTASDARDPGTSQSPLRMSGKELCEYYCLEYYCLLEFVGGLLSTM